MASSWLWVTWMKEMPRSRWKRFSWVKPVKVVSAELDPQRLNFMDASLLDNSRTLKPERGAARRVLADIAGLLQSFSALIATL